jgi:hypothetical protein
MVRKAWRKIHLEDEWLYRIGKSHVVIRTPDGNSDIVSFELLREREGPIYCESEEYEITPSMIREYIKDNLKK